MNNPKTQTGNEGPRRLTPELATACEVFENQWLSGKRPSIVKYLEDVEPEHRAAIVFELVRRDVERRRDAGDSPQTSAFAELLPQWAAEIDSAFEQASSVNKGMASTEVIETILRSPATVESPLSTSRLPVIGGYEITGKLGAGGMGAVYRAVQLSTKRNVALKTANASEFHSTPARMRFEREVELSARLEHPHIARVYESGQVGECLWFALELIDGELLDEHVRRTSKGEREIALLGSLICRAVQHAHQRGVIHRDLKPSNIMVDAQGEPRILDFGLAKATREEENEDRRFVTVDGAIAGTVAYMAPEQAAGRNREIDTRTDVYSLGVVLFRLLTGKSPHDLSGSQFEVIRRIVEDEVRTPREVNPQLNSDLAAILLKALAKEPDERYSNAGELADDIDRYLQGEPVEAHPASGFYYARKHIGKHRATYALAAILTTVAVATMAAYVVSIRAERDKTQQQFERAESNATAVQNLNKDLTDETRRANAEARIANENLRVARDANHSIVVARALETHEQGDWKRMGELLRQARFEYRETLEHRLACALWVQREQPPVTLRGDFTNATAVAYSPKGDRIATAHRDSTARVWNAHTGAELLTLPTDDCKITAVAYSPNGKFIVTAGGGEGPNGNVFGKAIVWSAKTGKIAATIAEFKGAVKSIAIGPDSKRLATMALRSRNAAEPGDARIWNIETGEELVALQGVSTRLTDIAFSPQGDRVAVTAWTGSKGEVLVCNAATGKPAVSFSAGKHPINALAFSPDGKRVATASWDHTARIWNATTGGEELVLPGHSMRLSSIAFSSDGARIATAGEDKTIRLWDAETGIEKFRFQGHAGSVTAVAIHPRSEQIATADSRGLVKIWDATRGAKIRSFQGADRSVNLAAYAPQGETIYASSYNGSIQQWNVQSGEQLQLISVEGLKNLAFNSDRTQVAATDYTKVFVRDIKSGKIQHEFSAGAQGAAFSPNGSWLVAGGGEKAKESTRPTGFVRMWNLKTGDTTLDFTTLSKVKSVQFSPSGERFATLGDDGGIRLWDTQTGSEQVVIEGGFGAFCSFGFTPDGEKIIVAHTIIRDGKKSVSKVEVWETTTGSMLIDSNEFAQRARAVACSPQGDRFAIVGFSGAIEIGDIATGKRLMAIQSSAKDVTDVSFSPNGTRVVVATTEWDGGVEYQGAVGVWTVGSR